LLQVETIETAICASRKGITMALLPINATVKIIYAALASYHLKCVDKTRFQLLVTLMASRMEQRFQGKDT
jgi:hypothetical protein